LYVPYRKRSVPKSKKKPHENDHVRLKCWLTDTLAAQLRHVLRRDFLSRALCARRKEPSPHYSIVVVGLRDTEKLALGFREEKDVVRSNTMPPVSLDLATPLMDRLPMEPQSLHVPCQPSQLTMAASSRS
jgi:hypothetical protein